MVDKSKDEFDPVAYLDSFGFDTEQKLVEGDEYGKSKVKEVEESWFFGASMPEQDETLEKPTGSSTELLPIKEFNPIDFLKELDIDASETPDTDLSPEQTEFNAQDFLTGFGFDKSVDEPESAPSQYPVEYASKVEEASDVVPIEELPSTHTPQEGLPPGELIDLKPFPPVLDDPEVIRSVAEEMSAPKISSLVEYYKNPSINLLINSVKAAQSKEAPEGTISTLTQLIADNVISESRLPKRPLDAEISKSIGETASGMVESVRERSGFSKAYEFQTGSSPMGIDPFDTGISEARDITEEQYQDRAIQEIAMKSGIDLNALTKALIAQRKIKEEVDSTDLTVQTRYERGQAAKMSADLLNVPLGLTTLVYGSAYTAFNPQNTGVAGELLDPASKMFKNTEDFRDAKEFLDSGNDIFTLGENLARLESGQDPISKINSLNKVVARSKKLQVRGTDIYVPEMLQPDIVSFIGREQEWKDQAVEKIVENIQSSFENMEIDVPVDAATVFESDVATPREKANVVADMLLSASFTGDIEAAMGKFYPLVRGVSLPSEGDTFGKSLAEKLNSAMGLVEGIYPMEARDGKLEPVDTPKIKQDFKDIFGDTTTSEVNKYSSEKIDNILSSYIQEKLIEKVGEQIREGRFGPAFFKESDTEAEKEYKQLAGSVLILTDYLKTRPEFATTKIEYFKRLSEGFAGVPEDILLSFIAIDVAINGYDPKENLYTETQVKLAKEKFENDRAYVLLDAAMFSSIAGVVSKGSITLQRALTKGAERALQARRASRASGSEHGFIRDSIEFLGEVSKETKIQLKAEKLRLKKNSQKSEPREDVNIINGEDAFTVFRAVFTEQPTPLRIQKKIRETEKNIKELEANPGHNPNELSILRLEKQAYTEQLEVLNAYYADEFEKITSRPMSREPGPVSFKLQKETQAYKTFKKAIVKEKESYSIHNQLRKKLTKKERNRIDSEADRLINTISTVTYPGIDPFAAGNAQKVINALQANGVRNYDVYKRFAQKTLDPNFKNNQKVIPELVAQVKVALYKEAGQQLGKIVNLALTKGQLAKLKNQSLADLLTTEQANAICAEGAASGITDISFYLRVPGTTDKIARYWVNEAKKALRDPKNQKAILKRNMDDGLQIYGRTKKLKRPKLPKGIRKSEFESAWGVTFDTTARLFFGDRAVSLAKNKDYTYAFLDFMTHPLAFFSVPRAMQNWISEIHLLQRTMGKTDSFFHSFLDSLITKENRLGTVPYYNLLALGADKNVDVLQFNRLLKQIPMADDFTVNSKLAQQIFDDPTLNATDFATVDAVSFDFIVQSLMSKDSFKIKVNGEDIVVNDFLTLEFDQTNKLRQDVKSLTKRIDSLKDGPLKKKLLQQVASINKKIQKGDVYVAVDELYASLPDLRKKLDELDEKLQKNPSSQSLLAERKSVQQQVTNLLAVTPEEALSGVTGLRWKSKIPFEKLSSVQKTVFYAAKQVILPIQEKIYNLMAQIMSAEDALIISQTTGSNAPRNIVVRVTDDGYVPVKIFDNNTDGASTAMDFASKLNQKAKEAAIPSARELADDPAFLRSVMDDLEDVATDPKNIRVQKEQPIFDYQTKSADELAVSGQAVDASGKVKGIPIVKRAMSAPATELPAMLSRYMSVYVDAVALKNSAKELFEASLSMGEKGMQSMVDSFARKMLLGFDNGTALVDQYGSPGAALKAILEMDNLEQVNTLGRALLPQERFYSNQAFGSVMTPAELASVTANSRFRLRNTFVGLAQNLEQYRIINMGYQEGMVITPSEFGLLSPRVQSRYVPMADIYSKRPGYGLFSPIIEGIRDKSLEWFGDPLTDPSKMTKTVGTVEAGKGSIFGNKNNLYMSEELAVHLSDFAGLVELSHLSSSKFLSIFKRFKVFNLTNGIIPVQILSSVFYHGYLLTKHPGVLMKQWMFSDGPSVFMDVVRVKAGLKPKDPRVEEAARRGTISVSADLDLNPAGINDTLFMVNALAASGEMLDDLSSNSIGRFVEKLEDIYNKAPGASQEFVNRLKVSFSKEARKPVRNTVGVPERPIFMQGIDYGLEKTLRLGENIQFGYSIFDEWLKTLNSIALNKVGVTMDDAVPKSIGYWYNYGNLSRNADAMRYGIISPFSSPFMGYLANSAYAFPALFADAPIRAAIAGHAANVHNKAAIETIKMYNEIEEMRMAMGDVMAFALPETTVEPGKLSKTYGPESFMSAELATFGQSTGTNRRIGAFGIENLVSHSLYRDPNSNLTDQIAGGRLFASPATAAARKTQELVRYLFDMESPVASKRKSDFAAEIDEYENEKEDLAFVIERVKERGGTPSKQDIERIEEINSYVSWVTRNDLRITGKQIAYDLFKSIGPTMVADLIEFLPNFFSIAPDKDPTRVSDYFGIKIAPADTRKLISSNVIKKSEADKLEESYVRLSKKILMADVSKEAKDLYMKRAEGMLLDIEKSESNEDVLEKLTEQQLRALSNYKAAVFSLYIAGKVDTFLKERFINGKTPFYYIK